MAWAENGSRAGREKLDHEAVVVGLEKELADSKRIGWFSRHSKYLTHLIILIPASIVQPLHLHLMCVDVAYDPPPTTESEASLYTKEPFPQSHAGEQYTVSLRRSLSLSPLNPPSYTSCCFCTPHRNAPKCSNRKFWEELKLFDGRKATTPAEMFEVCLDVLERATLTCVTTANIAVFRPQTPGSKDGPRCWNNQLVRYVRRVQAFRGLATCAQGQ